MGVKIKATGELKLNDSPGNHITPMLNFEKYFWFLQSQGIFCGTMFYNWVECHIQQRKILLLRLFWLKLFFVIFQVQMKGMIDLLNFEYSENVQTCTKRYLYNIQL